MAIRIQTRRGTAAQWTSANPVLAAGEQGYETDTGKIKVGDGTTAWSALPYPVDDAAAAAVDATPLAQRAPVHADAHGLSDATTDAERVTALNAAIADAVATGRRIVLPAGTFALGANPHIAIPEHGVIDGQGIGVTILTFTSGTCLAVGDGSSYVYDVHAGNMSIQGPGAGTAGTIGLHIREGRHGVYPSVAVDDCETGISVDGEDTWTDGNVIEKPRLNRNKYGIIFTADAGFQSNHNRIVGGSIYGDSPKIAGGIGVWFEVGDTNILQGTDVEDYETAIRFTAYDAGGNSLESPRIENCTNDIVIDSGVSKTVLMGHKNPAATNNGTVTQYGTRLSLPYELSPPAEAADVRGLVARQHGSGGQPDKLQIGMTRGDGVTQWHDIPTIRAETYGYLAPIGLYAADTATETAIVSGTPHLVHIGRAPHNLTTCDVAMHVTTAAATITWAEVAIYRGDSPTTVRRVGYTDVAASFNSTGRKLVTVALSDVMAGDELWVAYGSSATTPFQLRALLPDDLESGVFRTLGAQPSTTGNFTSPSNQWATAGLNPAWLTVRV